MRQRRARQILGPEPDWTAVYWVCIAWLVVAGLGVASIVAIIVGHFVFGVPR